MCFSIPSNFCIIFFILSMNAFPIIHSTSNATERTEACDILIAYDDTVMEEFNHSTMAIQNTLFGYVGDLNKIYEASVLKDAPNERIYFSIAKWVHLKNFAPDPEKPGKYCENAYIVLSEFSVAIDTSKYCLAHLFTKRNFGCIVGLGYVGTACSGFTNTAFTVLRKDRPQATIHTLAHEIGHNFGSLHDGENSTAYNRCTNETGNTGMMGGWKRNFTNLEKSFSTCSKAAIIATLQTIHTDNQKKKETDDDSMCFKFRAKSVNSNIAPNEITWSKSGFTCPEPDPKDDVCGGEDPPEPPETPDPPECGNRIVESIWGEECDCGKTYEQCDDPCCYPFMISEEDLLNNKTAKGCRRHTSGSCETPNYSTYKFGLIIPLVAFLIAVLSIALILFIDWRYGRRWCYSHILERKDYIHCEDEDQRKRRIERGNIID